MCVSVLQSCQGCSSDPRVDVRPQDAYKDESDRPHHYHFRKMTTLVTQLEKEE